MEIFVNGQRAALKKGSSFEYIIENRLFTDADSYTLSITFPLAGCQENIAIFGRLHRTDVVKGSVSYDCELRERAFSRFGTLTIVEVDEAEVKGQFLEGRSAQNYNTSFDDVYINELDLGEWPSTAPATPAAALGNYDGGAVCVAFPWVNSQTGNLQNAMVWDTEQQAFVWEETENTRLTLSWQPYLLVIAHRICDELHYNQDFTAWESDMLRFLLVCNTLPAAWGIKGFARALPHWSVTTFFEELEKLLNGEFDIDHRARKITFRFTRSVLQATPAVCLSEVTDGYKVDISDESAVTYKGTANRQYAEADHSMANFYCCDWYIKANADTAHHFASVQEMLAATAPYATPGTTVTTRWSNFLLYVENICRYYVLRVIAQVEGETTQSRGTTIMHNVYCLQLVNSFGAYTAGEDNDNVTVLEMVPACIDYTDEEHGFCLQMDPGTVSEDDTAATSSLRSGSGTIRQGTPCATIQAGEKESSSEFYDKIYIACWEGQLPENGKCPFPCVDSHFIDTDWTDRCFSHSLVLKGGTQTYLYDIDPCCKYTFYFLSDTIPDVRALFYIEGKRYLAEKITVTFTEDGMSRRMKGEFYMVE